MSAQQKIQERARPFLEEGEPITQVFPAQTGLHPY